MGYGRNDEEEEDANKNNNENAVSKEEKKDNEEYKLKKIEINYDNLIKLCLINSLKQGTIYTPTINLYKTTHKNKLKDLPQSIKDILKSLICDRVVLDSINMPNIKIVNTQFNTEGEQFFNYLEKEHINKKINMYKEINNECSLIHEYNNIYDTTIKSNQIIEMLISMQDYIEPILSNNFYVIVNFNYYQNINLEKIDKNLDKISTLLNFVKKYEENYSEPKNEKETLYDIEKNIYIFRIIFMIYFYLLFICKIILKYHYVTTIYLMINKMVNENYYYLGNFSKDKVINFIEDIFKIIMKIKLKVQGQITQKKKIFFDEGISLYINFMNLAVLREILNFVKKNQILKTIKFSELKQMSQKNFNGKKLQKKNTFPYEKNDHYFLKISNLLII